MKRWNGKDYHEDPKVESFLARTLLRYQRTGIDGQVQANFPLPLSALERGEGEEE